MSDGVKLFVIAFIVGAMFDFEDLALCLERQSITHSFVGNEGVWRTQNICDFYFYPIWYLLFNALKKFSD
jgi:hypothetical protein